MALTAGRGRTVAIYVATLLLGYALFILPNLYLGIFKPAGGLTGENRLWMGLFQLFSVSALVWFALRLLGGDYRDIGWDWSRWRGDALVGTVVGLAWALVEMLVVIPAYGGADQVDVADIIESIGGRPAAMAGWLVLGVLGGGVAEEIFNRGFTINVLRSAFANKRLGLAIAVPLSVVIFMVGHLPQDTLQWITILVPTLVYTALFVATRRLTAPIFAHGVHNAAVLAIIWFAYVA
ncbi:CPBP family intramembrane glutamic endopeptidase [Sphingomicrobium aestuariivivum]|uniref:CPBP family intramembrane glutamic endopeptidase n=1 Tax=Sphingomicrobium aestuariivivum TaxID=1582356 RepID=UPI001FD6A81D|nr:CPBP family intramembrane glutamic endopeptidase [Sphingomicrobium aestuariivivum]MCJ8190998.1 CPBP family intramembrane metalloprotease [Sphingomicrobium aestuariivivum]